MLPHVHRANCRPIQATANSSHQALFANTRTARNPSISRVAAVAEASAVSAGAEGDVQEQQQQSQIASLITVEQPVPTEQDPGSSSSDESATTTTSSSNGKDTEAATAALLAQIRAEVARRRNFAIISHPVSAAAAACSPSLIRAQPMIQVSGPVAKRMPAVPEFPGSIALEVACHPLFCSNIPCCTRPHHLCSMWLCLPHTMCLAHQREMTVSHLPGWPGRNSKNEPKTKEPDN